MADPGGVINPNSVQLCKFVGWAFIKNRQARADREYWRHTYVGEPWRGTPYRRPEAEEKRAPRDATTATTTTTTTTTTRDDDDDVMDDAEIYLETLGIPRGLPTLRVVYEKRTLGEREGKTPRPIAPGERFSSRHDAFLQAAPVVSWRDLDAGVDGEERRPRPRPRPHVVVMVDLDAPAPRTAGRRHLPGAAGPWLHALWKDCDGDTSAAATAPGEGEDAHEEDLSRVPGLLVPYNGPSPPSGHHRYVFVLFEQTDDAEVRADGRGVEEPAACRRKRWDFKKFLEQNPGLRPRAVNYFVCSRERH